MNLSISKRQQNEAFYQKMTHKKFSEETERNIKNTSKIDFEFTQNTSPKIWGYRF